MKRRLWLFLVAALALAGCKGDEQLDKYMDAASKDRLAQISAADLVYVSLKCATPPGNLPPLDGGQVFGRSGTTVLLTIPKRSLPKLRDVTKVQSAVVWGGSEEGKRLDPGLRAQLLGALDENSEQTSSVPMIATFRSERSDLEAQLRAMGAETRTVAGRVVTLDATPEVVFSLIAMDDLVNLTRPRKLNPLFKK